MPPSMINKRELMKMFSGVGIWKGMMRRAACAVASPPLRVAAVQMTADLADVESNMTKAERLVRSALKRGASWVILPEFFTSGMAFHPDMANAIRSIDGPPGQLLRRLAREGSAFVGGSFLAWRGANVYNTFLLALPDGSTLRHDKDFPSFLENCYYIGGDDDGVLQTPLGKVGVALCWETIRSGTAARLSGKVGMIVAGSCWWTGKDTVTANGQSFIKEIEIMKATPGRLARMVGVPMVHAAHAGSFVGRDWPSERVPYPSHYLGETQIVDGKGDILARMSREDGEGVIIADISFGSVPEGPAPIPGRYWIAEFSEELYRQWERDLKTGHEYYLSTTLPSIKKRMRDQARR